MSNKELLPCPFCGGEAEIIRHENIGLTFIECKSCDVRNSSSDEDLVIKAWNSRNYLEKQDSSKEMPLVPEWQENKGVAWLIVELDQYNFVKFEFKKQPKILYRSIQNKVKDYFYFEDVGKFKTLEEAKQKANECIRELGEKLVYFANNIKTKE